MSRNIEPGEEEAENHPYTFGQDAEALEASMPGKKKPSTSGLETFGQRLARLRKAAGYSQRSLAAELGIAYRVIAYYEAQTEHIPANLLPALSEALGITADQLLGREPTSPRKAPQNQRLLRKLRQVEKLPPRARRVVLETIDALLAKYQASA
jgi:transcriptional regulator with XRE-family HTH domain